jgi:hypothetical protein
MSHHHTTTLTEKQNLRSTPAWPVQRTWNSHSGKERPIELGQLVFVRKLERITQESSASMKVGLAQKRRKMIWKQRTKNEVA